MHPDLFRIGPITIHTYGVMVAIGFLLGVGLALNQARKEGISPERISDLSFYLLLAAIIGSRVFYILLNPGPYIKNPLAIFKIWEGGLVFYGGLIFAVITGVIYIKRHSLNLWQVADIFAPSIAIGHAIGRLGCFFAGCCHGRPADLPWAVTFTDPHSLAPLGIPLHPTQLYEAAGEFVNFIILLILRKRKSFKGELFWTYVMLYSILRFSVEFFRGDAARGMLAEGLSLAQAISVIMFFIAVGFMTFLRGRGAEKR
ncbi:MAG: prolipoprotein diacylglyceryl transferase [Thermodesulfovibrionales bacterium]